MSYTLTDARNLINWIGELTEETNYHINLRELCFRLSNITVDAFLQEPYPELFMRGFPGIKEEVDVVSWLNDWSFAYDSLEELKEHIEYTFNIYNAGYWQ